jgi:hypothetical protein
MKCASILPGTFLVLWWIAPATAPSWAKNIDLSTVPDRETVQLTIYNSEDLTLVRETRKLSFKRGVNPLQFSWANTLIDPTSVELKFLTQTDKLELLETTFPHDKPQMLYWNVESELDGEAAVQITYFTSGISWSADYVCIANTDETEMSLQGYVRVFNNSGEEYEQAQVRLIVGQVNLVEKIAELARVPVGDLSRLGKAQRGQLRFDAFHKLTERAEEEAEFRSYGYGDVALDDDALARPKEVVKEGLSEYFIYTIEGTETIPNGWSKRLRSMASESVPLKIQYRYREPEYGNQLVRMYLLQNDKDSNLGTTPLPDGVVRVFRHNGRDGLSFLAAQPTKYIPIGDKIELNLGPDPNVDFDLRKLAARRENIWMRIRGSDVYRRVDDGRFRIEVNSTVAGWNDHTVYSQRVRNHTDKPIQLEVRRVFPGHVLFRSDLNAVNHDYQTVQYQADLRPGEYADLLYELVTHQGRNKKQENVTIESRRVEIPGFASATLAGRPLDQIQ